MSTIEEKPQPDRQRKSLAVDQRTYDLLQEICFDQRRRITSCEIGDHIAPKERSDDVATTGA